jgi:hypothetical protein
MNCRERHLSAKYLPQKKAELDPIMRWRYIVLMLGVGGVALAATTSAEPSRGTSCNARTARASVAQFLAVFNKGDLQRLDRLVAHGSAFRRYVVAGNPGQRVAAATVKRSTLIRYFARRHQQSERLLLMRFRFDGRARETGAFEFELVRDADDINPSVLYVGRGAISCARRHQLVVWTMGPNPEPRLPVPQSYADTCRLVSSWCGIDPGPGAVPDSLRRALALPSVPAGAPCPTTAGEYFANSQFGGIALGEGPVQPIVGRRLATALRGTLTFRPYAQARGWYFLKTLWFARPEYHSSVLIRARQLNGTHGVAFGEGPALADPQMGPGATLNGIDGWREWPGGTWLRTPGCYAWQIDGTDFTYVIVFEAIFRS